MILPPNAKERLEHGEHFVLFLSAEFFKAIDINHHLIIVKLCNKRATCTLSENVRRATNHDSHLRLWVLFQVAQKLLHFRLWYHRAVILEFPHHDRALHLHRKIHLMTRPQMRLVKFETATEPIVPLQFLAELLFVV